MLGHRPDGDETDRALSALSNACRRRLLFELYEELNAGDTANIEYSGLTSVWTEGRRDLLHHVHLPKLETYGYIRWNRAERTIRKGSRWEEIEPLLELFYSNLYELPPFLQGGPSDRRGTKS